MSSVRITISRFASVLTLAICGCNLSHFSTPSTASSTLPAISGTVHGGQQPISGATIQLYAANTSVTKGPASPLISTPVLTNANGSFNITGDYTCPAPGALVYIVATGGNPGLPGSVNNTGIALMSVLGTCGNLSSSTYIVINELTTIAAVEGLAPFMSDYGHIGASSVSALTGAISTSASFVNFSTGALAQPVAGVTLPSARLYTLADILAACVNSKGGVSGDNSLCGNLFLYSSSGTVTDTLAAALHIINSPRQNVSSLFALTSATSPFQPGLSSTPTDFSTPLVINLPRLTTVLPQGYFVIIDALQHIWVYVSAESYNSSTKTYSYATGSVLIFDNRGNLLHTIPASAGSLYLPFAGTADPFGNVWSLNSNGVLSKVDSDGDFVSPAGGYPYPFNNPPNIVLSPGQAGEDVSSLASDPAGNIWGIGLGTGNQCYNKVSNNGSPIVAGSFCGLDPNNVVAQVMPDGSGDAWMLGTNSISKVSASGSLLAKGVNTNGCFDFYPTGSQSLYNDTLNMVYDRSHDQLWGIGYFSIGSLRADGTQVFCHANGSALPLILTDPYKSLLLIASTVDGVGNLWFATGGTAYANGSYTGIGGLNELDTNGNLLTPFNTSSGVYGLDVGGSLQPGVSSGGVQALAIDASGAIWTVNNVSYTLTKIPGLAAGKNYQ